MSTSYSVKESENNERFQDDDFRSVTTLGMVYILVLPFFLPKIVLSYFQTKLSKILSIKKQWIQELKEMNTRAEKQVCVCICSLKKKIIVH